MNSETVIIPSYTLQDLETFYYYVNEGYEYIRKFHKPYNVILRDPSIGCYVMLSKIEYSTFFSIYSYKGRNLIKRHSYF